MIPWIRYRWMLWQANRRRKKAHEGAFIEYVNAIESLAGVKMTQWQKSVIRATFGEYKKVQR